MVQECQVAAKQLLTKTAAACRSVGNATYKNCPVMTTCSHLVLSVVRQLRRKRADSGLVDTNPRHDDTWCTKLLTSLSMNRSRRVMLADYFMLLQTLWGGCGCYSQTDQQRIVSDSRLQMNYAVRHYTGVQKKQRRSEFLTYRYDFYWHFIPCNKSV